MDSIINMLIGLWESTGFVTAGPSQWQNYIMIAVSVVLFYLAIVKGFEPLLLLPIAFGMFIINIPGAQNVLYGADHDLLAQYTELYKDKVSAEVLAGVNEELLIAELSRAVDLNGDGIIGITRILMENGAPVLSDAGAYFAAETGEAIIARSPSYGLFHYVGMGVQYVIFPPIIFLGIGAMTDFGPLIANPKSLLMGAGAQLGVFLAFIGAKAIGLTPAKLRL